VSVSRNEDELRKLGRILKRELEGTGLGFALLIFDLGERGHMSYMSSAHRADMIEALRELVARLETGTVAPPGQPRHPFNRRSKA
jgi:hypothetical protein